MIERELFYLSVEVVGYKGMEVVRVQRVPERIVGAVRPSHIDSRSCKEIGNRTCVFTSSPVPIRYTEGMCSGLISCSLICWSCGCKVLDVFVNFFLLDHEFCKAMISEERTSNRARYGRCQPRKSMLPCGQYPAVPIL
jgi:hypothetical protein